MLSHLFSLIQTTMHGADEDQPFPRGLLVQPVVVVMGDNIPQCTRQTDRKKSVPVMLVSLNGSRTVIEYQKWRIRREHLVDKSDSVKVGTINPSLHPVDESLRGLSYRLVVMPILEQS